jgi:hypothetical protein
MIEFAIAVFFLLITPGPGVLTTAGIGAAYGFRAGLGFMTGLCLGGFINMMIVISGLAAIVLAVPALRTALLFASVAYRHCRCQDRVCTRHNAAWVSQRVDAAIHQSQSLCG